MRLVGLTGGIATGKSTVARHLARRGIPVLDADVVARDVLADGSVLEAVRVRFPDVFRTDGSLDRGRLRSRIAGRAEDRRDLDALTHPPIRARIAGWVADQEAAGAPMAVVEAALLVETGAYRQYPELLVVACAPDVQRARLLARDGGDPAVAEGLMRAQASLSDKRALATAVLDNDGTEDQLFASVDRWLAETRGAV